MKRIFFVLIILNYFGIPNVYSEPLKQHVFATLSGGPAWYQAGQTQTIYVQSNFNNTYVAQKNTQALARGELFLGVQNTWFSHYLTQWGLGLGINKPATLRGSIWELADPIFDNFTYRYKMLHRRIAVQGRILADTLIPSYLPYVSASLGAGFNRSYDFSMKPLIFQTLPQPPFQSHTQTAFTYTIGLGVFKSISTHWQVGIGYEFADAGKSSLGPSSVQNTSQRLTLNHFYTNELQCSLSYVV